MVVGLKPSRAVLEQSSIMREKNYSSESVSLKPLNTYNTQSEKYTIEVYGARWLMLAIFMICCVWTQVHTFQMLIISQVLVKFFPVDELMIRMTGLICSINFLLCLGPNCYLLNKMNMRQCVVIGITVTAVGSWLKVLAVRPERFNYMLAAQFIAVSGQGLLVNSSAMLASLWFPSNEISTACCLAQTGVVIGIALGFFLPPLMVPFSEDPSQIGRDLRFMMIIVASFTTITLLSTLIFFKAAPSHPPSVSQALATAEAEAPGFISVARTLMRKRYVLLFFLTSAIANGHFVTINNFTGPLFIAYFPEYSQSVGLVCTSQMLCGFAGMILGGVIMDKTKKFKETLVGFTFLCGLAIIAMGFTLELRSVAWSYVSFSALGFVESGMLAITFEVLAETTYPEPSLLTATYLSAANFVFAVIFTSALNAVFSRYAPIWTIVVLGVIIIFAAFSMIGVPIKLRRQNAHPV